jgi:hypothetical protein
MQGKNRAIFNEFLELHNEKLLNIMLKARLVG